LLIRIDVGALYSSWRSNSAPMWRRLSTASILRNAIRFGATSRGFGRRGGTSYSRLLAMLRDGHHPPDLRAAVCWVLAQPGSHGRRAAPALLEALADASAAVRIAAAQALGQLGAPRAVPHLITALVTDDDGEVRRAAAYALGLIGDEGATRALVWTLNSKDGAPAVRGMAAESLTNVGAKSAVPALLATLDDPSAEVRFWSAFALGELGGPESLPELGRVAARDMTDVPGWGTVSHEAAEAIERIQGKVATAGATGRVSRWPLAWR